jgi:hypothetical protein
METQIKVMRIAERYRRIAKRTFDSKVAGEIERIAADYERFAASAEMQLH